MIKTLTIAQVLLEGRDRLKSIANIRPALESELLLAYMLGVERVWLHIHDYKTLTQAQINLFFTLIAQRLKHIPIEYITNKASFFNDVFYVDCNVLIPRPESEILVSEVCELIKKEGLEDSVIIEVGVGSGALSISVAKHFKNLKIIGIDICPKALSVAERNILDAGLGNQIILHKTSLLKGIDEDFIARFAMPPHKKLLVFSNPPYIAKNYALEKNVLYEPEVALFGGVRGSEILEELISQCASKNVAFLACEIGYNQGEIMAKTLESKGYEARFYNDLAGFTRGFVAKFK